MQLYQSELSFTVGRFMLLQLNIPTSQSWYGMAWYGMFRQSLTSSSGD